MSPNKQREKTLVRRAVNGPLWLEPGCPKCGDRLFPIPQPNPQRLSHICWNGHKWRNDG